MLKSAVNFLARNELLFRRLLVADKVLLLKLLGLKLGKNCIIARSSRWPARQLSKIVIDDNVIVGANTHIGVAGNPERAAIWIYDNVGIGEFCRIGAMKHVSIGPGTLIADNVTIQDCEHTFEENKSPCNTPLAYKKCVIIGANCFIGRNSVILGGTILPDNTIVGANSVVKGDYYSVCRQTLLITGLKATIRKRRWAS